MDSGVGSQETVVGMGCGSSLAGQVREGESLARARTGTEPAARVTVVLSYWVRQLIACDSKSCLAVAAVGRRGTAKLLQCWLLCSPTNHCALHHLGKPRARLPARTSLWAGASSQLWELHALQQALTLSCSSAEHLSPLCVCLCVHACVRACTQSANYVYIHGLCLRLQQFRYLVSVTH